MARRVTPGLQVIAIASLIAPYRAVRLQSFKLTAAGVARNRSRALLLRQPASKSLLRPRLLAEAALRNLLGEHMPPEFAGRRERQLRDDVHHLGQLVVGHLAFEVADHLRKRHRLSGLGNDAETIALAEALVGDADQRRVHDLGMGVEDLLDLAGEKLLAPAVDDLLQPTDDLDVAGRIDDPAEIAGAKPSVGRKRLGIGRRIGVVAEMDARSQRGDLADLAGSHLPAL